MVACLPGDSAKANTCVPLCRSCGRDLAEDDRVPNRDRGQRFWRNQCGCVAEPEPEPDYGFSETEVGRFKDLLIARGCNDQVADGVAWYLLNSLAHTGTKVVLGLPDGDIVVTAEEGSTVVGRGLRTTAAGEGPTD